MTWNSGTWFAFDTETTGVDVTTDRVVTATVAKLTAGEMVDTREWALNPGVDIPKEAARIHGITTEMARANGVEPGRALSEISETITGVLRSGHPLVVMNAAFDLSIVEYELRRHRVGSIMPVVADTWGMVIDPYALARGLDNHRRVRVRGRKHNLPALCERYGVAFVESHDATADAVGAGLVAAAIYDQEPILHGMSPPDLANTQLRWFRDDKRSFAEWASRSGKDYGPIDDGWPFHTSLLTASQNEEVARYGFSA